MALMNKLVIMYITLGLGNILSTESILGKRNSYESQQSNNAFNNKTFKVKINIPKQYEKNHIESNGQIDNGEIIKKSDIKLIHKISIKKPLNIISIKKNPDNLMGKISTKQFNKISIKNQNILLNDINFIIYNIDNLLNRPKPISNSFIKKFQKKKKRSIDKTFPQLFKSIESSKIFKQTTPCKDLRFSKIMTLMGYTYGITSSQKRKGEFFNSLTIDKSNKNKQKYILLDKSHIKLHSLLKNKLNEDIKFLENQIKISKYKNKTIPLKFKLSNNNISSMKIYFDIARFVKLIYELNWDLKNSNLNKKITNIISWRNIIEVFKISLKFDGNPDEAIYKFNLLGITILKEIQSQLVIYNKRFNDNSMVLIPKGIFSDYYFDKKFKNNINI
jgi:hypothetical protein